MENAKIIHSYEIFADNRFNDRSERLRNMCNKLCICFKSFTNFM